MPIELISSVSILWYSFCNWFHSDINKYSVVLWRIYFCYYICIQNRRSNCTCIYWKCFVQLPFKCNYGNFLTIILHLFNLSVVVNVHEYCSFLCLFAMYRCSSYYRFGIIWTDGLSLKVSTRFIEMGHFPFGRLWLPVHYMAPQTVVRTRQRGANFDMKR